MAHKRIRYSSVRAEELEIDDITCMEQKLYKLPSNLNNYVCADLATWIANYAESEGTNSVFVYTLLLGLSGLISPKIKLYNLG